MKHYIKELDMTPRFFSQEFIDKNLSDEFIQKLVSVEQIIIDIFKDSNGWCRGCGSYLFDGQTYSYCDKMFNKQKLLFEKCKNKTNILEIGTYMGHSLLIMLLANPKLSITCIDIESRFSLPATNILKRVFPESKITFICNDSLKVLQTLNDKFDLFHIDGNHENSYIQKEFLYCKDFVDGDTMTIVFDDIGCCRQLESDIIQNYNVLEHITPECLDPNSYFVIKL